jgi:cysteine synthase A
VVEYTGGSTGVSLALVCAVKGHPFYVVTSDAFAREKLDHMRLLGADLTIVPSEGGGMTRKLTKHMVAAAKAISKRTGAFMTDQLRNPDPISGYDRMAEEIWRQTDGRISALVQAVGTAGSVRGLAEGFKRRGGAVKIVAVEPAESAVLSGEPSGAHKIDGIGVGFMPPLWRSDVVDEIEKVSTHEANAMALKLAREEGLFAGSSTGANVVAALRLAERSGPEATIVTIMCDTGMKYLKTFGKLARAR